MAAVAEGANENGFYWIRDKSDEERPVVYVTGASKKMGLKFGSGNGIKGKIKQKSFSMDKSGKKSLPLTTQSATIAVGKASFQKLFSTTAKPIISAPEPALAPLASAPVLAKTIQAKSKASLKDLCPEDKRRIANLIQELARVSEEKEESVQKLKDEQESFEKKIQQLEQQNQLIFQERESLQQQYRECQELLGLYQQYLSQQQEKLNKSITLLHQTCSHSKVPSSEGGPRRPWCGGGRGTALDGSYLDLPLSGNGAERVGSVDCYRSFSVGPCSAHSSCVGQNCDVHDRCTSHNFSEGGRSDPRSNRCSDREPSKSDAPRLRGESSHQCQGLENGSSRGSVRTELAPHPGRGDLDWEEKRQRLLLQKKQLEVERERIQARLAEQEEKLLWQNQQLHQSYLHYSKLQQATATDFEKSLNGGSFNEGLQTSCVGEQVTRSSEIKDREKQTLQASVRQPLHTTHSQEHTANRTEEHPTPVLSHENSITKKDMATSPVVPQSFRTSALPVIPPLGLPSTPQASKLDDSLIDLLDILSPASNTERYQINSTARKSFITPLPSQRTLLSSPGSSRPSLHDLEESQILEDIFFIC